MHAHHEVQKRASFEQVFRAHYRAVERFVMAQYSTLDHDEILSRTFEVAWRRFDDAPQDAVRGWLLGIARNHSLNSIRGRRRRLAMGVALAVQPRRQVSSLHDERVPAEVVERLAAALQQLSQSDREVIELAAAGGLSGADLGAAFGISAGAASVRLHRARQRLNDVYGAAG